MRYGKSATVATGTGGFGVDMSPAMLDVARPGGRGRGARPSFVDRRARGDPPQLVHSRNALHHLPDFWKGVALSRTRDLLTPGGVLVLRDLVYDFGPAEADRNIEEWLAGATPDSRGGLDAR